MPFTANDILAMIAAGEGQNVEFKRDISQRSDTAGELIAFANTSGGTLLVGVTDDGQIIGVSDPDATMNALANISRDNCRPSLYPIIARVDVNGMPIIAVRVEKRTGPPYENNSGQCYIRVGATKQLASPQQRARMLQQSGLYHFDETPVAGTTLADLERDAFRNYFEKISRQPIEATGVALERLLEGTRVAATVDEVQRLTVAGLLVFGREPQRYMRHARITAVRFLGDDSTADRLNPQEIIGTLPQLVQQCGEYVKLYNGVYSQIEGFVRRERPFCPEEVLREVVVNAVAHRDYSIAGSQIRLFFFDNHLEVRSPGRLPNSMTLESIRFYNHESRNPLIAQFLNRLGFMEEFGTGIPNMIRLMRSHNGTEPEFAIEGEEFVVRLFANGITREN
jgi:ATP-dependent DNA helicase RecG